MVIKTELFFGDISKASHFDNLLFVNSGETPIMNNAVFVVKVTIAVVVKNIYN